MYTATSAPTCGIRHGGVSQETFTAQFQSVVTELYSQQRNETTDEGVMLRFDPEENCFILATSEGTRKTITIDGETEYSLDGEQSTKSEVLRTGRDATVRHVEQRAIRVEAKAES